MRSIQSYKIFENSKPGTSVGEIRDLLADLIDNNFYVEVNIDHGPDNEETIDEGPVGVEKEFNIVIMTQYNMDYDPMNSEDEDMDDSLSKFCWNDVSDSVNQLIDFLEDRFHLKRCKANMMLPDRKGKMDNFILDIGYDEVDDEKLPIDLDNEEAEQHIKGHEPFIYVDDKIICNVCVEFGPKKRKENIKKFEEFDWHSLISDTTFKVFAGWAVANVFARFASKYLNHRNKKKFFNRLMNDPDKYGTRAKWEIEYRNPGKEDIIDVYRKVGRDRNLQYTLNKTNRTIHVLSAGDWSIKVSKEDFSNLLDDLKWTQEVSSTIEDFYYDLRDDGYDPSLRSVDFKHRCIVITLERVQVEPSTVNPFPDDHDDPYDVHWDQGGGPYYDDGKKFAVLDILEHIEEFISQIEGTYGVKIDDNYKQDRRIYTNERILKSNTIPDFKNDIKDAGFFNVTTLVIPFVKK